VAAVGSSVLDPVKKKTRAGGGRSQPEEEQETVCSRQRADRDAFLPWKTGERHTTVGRTKCVVRLRQQKTAVNIRVRSWVLSWLRRREERGVAAEWEAAIVSLSISADYFFEI